MVHLILRLVINAVALGIAAAIVPGIQFAGEGSVSIGSLAIVALIFGLINAIIKPILALATCPFYILTLGLFTFVVNALMLMLTSWLAGPRFEVAGFWSALLGSIIISIISTLLSALLGEARRENREHSHLVWKE
jgi:putative membrane protein